MSQTIACSLVSSRLDYANSLFVCVSDLEVKRLQRIQNSLARVVLSVPLRTCSSVLLHQLHWLPVEFRIRFKLACLSYKALSTSKPTYMYLHALLTPYTPVVVLLTAPRQTKESARRDDHMFLLFGCGPYVSIVWRSAICFYCVALRHMFLLCRSKTYVSIFSIKTIWSPLQWNRWLVT